MEYLARTPAQLGPILKSCRVQRGLSQQDAGAKVGLKQGTVSVMENHPTRTSVESLYKLLSSLGLELVIRDKQGTSSAQASSGQEW